MNSRKLTVLVWVGLATPGCVNVDECVDTWSACMLQTPNPAVVIAAAETEYQDCLAACPSVGSSSWEENHISIICAQNCLNVRDHAIAEAQSASRACDQDFSGCATANVNSCLVPASDVYLKQVNVADWNLHTAGRLADVSTEVAICVNHFPVGSDARAEAEDAVAQYANISGTSINMSARGAVHLDKGGLFGDPPTAGRIDYINNEIDPAIHPCHPDNETSCRDNDEEGVNGFTLNACSYRDGSWGGGGTSTGFVVNVNGSCYEHYDDVSSSNYVPSSGYGHELGHTVGQKHITGWPAEDLDYISTMQGNLDYLSAYDIAFMRHFYPRIDTPELDFVASSKIRMNLGLFDAVNATFKDANPWKIYLVGDRVYDCATNERAMFHAAWFNTGLADQDATDCMMNELRIEDTKAVEEATLMRWQVASMPAESQDQWRGWANATAADFENIRRDKRLDLVFEVNVQGQHVEDRSNNIVRRPIRLYPDATCGVAPLDPPLPVAIEEVGPLHFELASGVAADFMTHPERILRSAALAPHAMGSGGIGFKLFNLEENSVLARLGLRKNDLLWRIGGAPITGMATVAAAYQQLVTTGQIVLLIGRDNQLHSITYTLR